MVGLEMSDCLAVAALVLADGGAFNVAAALVCDRVLRAGAVGRAVAGVDTMRCLCLIIGIDVGGNCAVVGTTLGVAGGVGGNCCVMDRVIRMFEG